MCPLSSWQRRSRTIRLRSATRLSFEAGGMLPVDFLYLAAQFKRSEYRGRINRTVRQFVKPTFLIELDERRALKQLILFGGQSNSSRFNHFDPLKKAMGAT